MLTWTVVQQVSCFTNCCVYHLNMHDAVSTRQRCCFVNSMLLLLGQTLLPYQTFSPLSDDIITSAHYLTSLGHALKLHRDHVMAER